MEDNYYVYAYVRLDTNTFFYIGKGKKKRYLNINSRSDHFKNIINKTECAVEILYDNLTEDEAFQLEVDTIYDLVFNEGYGIDIIGINNDEYYLVNCTWGGEGASMKQSEEVIANRVAKNTGQKRTEEQKQHLREGMIRRLERDPHSIDSYKYSRLGVEVLEETRRKMSEWQIGRELTEEHKNNISNGLNNRSQEEKDKANEKRSKTQGTAIYCIELDLTFASVHKAEKYCHDILGISFNHKTFKKYMSGTWTQDRYLEIDINGVLTKLHWQYC